MKDDAWLRQIRSFVPPAADSAGRERARLHALAEFRGSGMSKEDAVRYWPWWWAWGAVALVLAMALTFAFPWRASPPVPAPNDSALLAQIEHVFPGELNAVIERNGQVQLALTDQPGAAPDQPLLVEFRRDGSVVRVLSYSGRHVCLDLDGRRACFEALLNERGEVIVAGEDFVATPALGLTAHGWNVLARSLPHSS